MGIYSKEQEEVVALIGDLLSKDDKEELQHQMALARARNKVNLWIDGIRIYRTRHHPNNIW